MNRIFTLAFIFITFIIPANSLARSSSKNISLALLSSSSDTTYRIIHALDGTFGYEILVDRKVLIRQLTIPGRHGRKGFTSKKDAETIAKIVIGKLRNHIIPPTISEREIIHSGIQ